MEKSYNLKIDSTIMTELVTFICGSIDYKIDLYGGTKHQKKN